MIAENIDYALFKLEDALSTYIEDFKITKGIEVIFLGSQSILFHHRDISNQHIISSYEVDIIVLLEQKDKLEKISDLIDFVYGYQSELHNEKHFYIDNMTDTEDLQQNTRNFPTNWRSRSSRYPCNHPQITFTTLDPHDVAILKMAAYREKDLSYVQTLIQGSILQKKKLLQSLNETTHFTSPEQRQRIKRKINYFYQLEQINIHKTPSDSSMSLKMKW